VSVRSDRRGEPDETFFVNLNNASGATIADAQGQGTIVNDDGGTGGPAGGLGLMLPDDPAPWVPVRSTPPDVSLGSPTSLPIIDNRDRLVADTGTKTLDTGLQTPRSSASTATKSWAFDTDWWASLSPVDETAGD
jgi:hypothetical protein